MVVASLKFQGVFLQDEPVRSLVNSLSKNKIFQTYLFLGSESVGKRRVAKAFAATLECLSPQPTNEGFWDCCEKCLSCKRILLDTHPDVTFLTPIGTEIRVDQVRRMHEMAFLNPFLGKWRIFIIDPADRLNEFSSNSLLKILEEAPPRVLFILLAKNPDRIVNTIKSRAVKIYFRSPSHQSARDTLYKIINRPPDEICMIYSACDGLFGMTLQHLSSQETFVQNQGKTLGESQVWYLSELGKIGAEFQNLFSHANSLEFAQKIFEGFKSVSPITLLLARKAFTREIALSPFLPAAFPTLFTKYLFEKIDRMKLEIRHQINSFLAGQKENYSSSLLKVVGEQFQQMIEDLGNRHVLDFFQSLLFWHSDFFRFKNTQDVTLLLNLDRKEDIMNLSRRHWATKKIECLKSLLSNFDLFAHNVNPTLILEDTLMRIGENIPWDVA
ncbi:DNA polymerase III subunit delta' [bacterium]|nr:DNA polymerase III subunit delta' [bacterium]